MSVSPKPVEPCSGRPKWARTTASHGRAYIEIYMWSPPPPLDRPRKYISGLFRKGGGGGGKHHSKIPRVSKNPKSQKIQPRVPLFGNSSGSLKILNPSKVLEFPKFKKKSTPRFGFLETRAGASKSKNRANSSSFQSSKNPKNSTPRFGFLETRAGASKSKNRANSSSFQNSQPWGGLFLDFWNFGNSRKLLDFLILRKFLEFPKFQKLQPKFRIFGNSSGSLKIQNRANSSSFQNSKPWGVFFWIFGILETRGICSISGF